MRTEERYSMNAKPILITKRNGDTEPLNIDKLHKVVQHACDGINGVSASEVELKSQISFFNKMKSHDIQETLINAAAGLISEESPNYQYVAGRLINYQLRKQVYGSYEPHNLYDHVKRVTDLGWYTPELLEWYTEKDFETMNAFIDHSRDEEFAYVAMEQFRAKYLVQNRVTKEYFETPQMCYILIAATLFHSYPERTRMKYIKDYYDTISQGYISLATPVMAGVRTPQKQFSSCVLIDCDDSLKSINATASSIVNYVSNRAGIGVNFGRIRGLNSPIRKGDAYHTGVLPFLKHFNTAIHSCSQGGVRKGSGTFYYPFWHIEFEDLIVLKNNKGTTDVRVRHIDYGVQLNELFYKRYLNKEDITFFCPNDVPELYDAFFSDQELFKELYEKAERNTRLRKKKLPAREVFGMISQERVDTGRIYIMNVDNCNTHSSFVENRAPIKMSNLCCEITLPTKPLNDVNDENGRIALCTLSAINLGKINNPEDFRKPCDLAVRALDALLSYQDFPVKAAAEHTLDWRPLGIGVTNLAYFLAKNGLTYNGDQETLDTIDEFTESFSYYLIKASVDLAREYEPCRRVDDTKYGQGILPIDTYKKDVDGLVKRALICDWKTLRTDLKMHGIRNATLMAFMPCETSSQILNSTNGVEPIRDFISVKGSKEKPLPIVAPGYPRLKNKYDLLWDIKSPEGYLKICAVFQKYVDQAISVNTSYNPEHYESGKIPASILIRNMLLHYKWGGKTLYYNNTYDGQGEIDIDKDDEKSDNTSTDQEASGGCESGACAL